MHDILARQLAQLALTESEVPALLHAIIAAIPEGFCVIDGERRVVFMNSAGLQLLGAEAQPELLVGLPVAKLVPRQKNARRALRSAAHAVELALSEGQSSKNEEAVLCRLDGSAVLVSFSVTSVHGLHSKTAILLFRDISEQKQLEISLRHAQKLESIGRLAAGIAHEINTPIQFIGDNVRFLGDSFKDIERLLQTLREVIHEHGEGVARAKAARAFEEADAEYVVKQTPRAIENSLEGVRRVATIVQAMKSLAHHDRGEKTLSDLNAAITNTLTVAHNEYKYVADVVTHFGDIPPVHCYLNDVNQVILNLLVNAAHAVGDKVAGTEQRGLITISTSQEADSVLLSFQDSGVGIPEENRQRIFEPFFTTKEVGRGTGQGLALARAVIVDKHQGSLTFETEIGKGTTFFVRLPLVEGSRTADVRTQDLDSAGAQGA